LNASWLGTVLTDESLAILEQKALEYRFNVDGEGGEYETLVIGGPHLPGRLEVQGEVVWQGTRGTFEFTEVNPVPAD
jgi:diphthamide synthase (EF-2-diphthine--ammonia ligase)